MSAARPTSRRQRGFALIAVLWIVVGLSVLALSLNLAGRGAVDAVETRTAIARARWRAEGCVEIARAAIAAALAGQANWYASRVTWSNLDEAVTTDPALAEARCDVDLRPVGIGLNVNTADRDGLRSLFRAAGLPLLTSDSLSDAVLNWRDGDDSTRVLGPTRSWYESVHAFSPRGGPFADMRELRRVRGYAAASAYVPALDSLLTTEPGRIFFPRASLPVLATIRGVDEEALGRIADLRRRDAGPKDLASLAPHLSPAGRTALSAEAMTLQRILAIEPDAWILTARATSSIRPSLIAWVELRLVHAGPTAAVVRRRTGP